MKTPTGKARHDHNRTRVHKDKTKYDRKAELNQVGWDEWLWPFHKSEKPKG